MAKLSKAGYSITLPRIVVLDARKDILCCTELENHHTCKSVAAEDETFSKRFESRAVENVAQLALESIIPGTGTSQGSFHNVVAQRIVVIRPPHVWNYSSYILYNYRFPERLPFFPVTR